MIDCMENDSLSLSWLSLLLDQTKWINFGQLFLGKFWTYQEDLDNI